MKKLSLLSISFLVCVIVASIFTVSCEKDNLSEYDSQPISADQISHVAEMHNNLVSVYLTSNLPKSSSHLLADQLAYVFKNVDNLYMENHPSDHDELVLSTGLQSIVQFAKQNSYKANEFETFAQEYFLDLNKKLKLSDYFYQELVKVIGLAHAMDGDQLIEYLSNEFAQDVSIEEEYLKDLLVNVCKASNEIWTEEASNRTQLKAAIKPSSTVILFDGLGGIVGLFAGGLITPLAPVTSIAAATALSIAVNENVGSAINTNPTLSDFANNLSNNAASNLMAIPVLDNTVYLDMFLNSNSNMIVHIDLFSGGRFGTWGPYAPPPPCTGVGICHMMEDYFSPNVIGFIDFSINKMLIVYLNGENGISQDGFLPINNVIQIGNTAYSVAPGNYIANLEANGQYNGVIVDIQ